ncbi:hypothetical protein ACFT38_48145, partial [Streptomyces sp. NPDC056975]
TYDSGGISLKPAGHNETMKCDMAGAAAVFAAVVAFVQGSLLGIVWVLLAGLTSNMTWYYVRRAKAEKQAKAAVAPTA